MRYRTLGKTGLRPSVIGVGTWQFGGEWGVDFTQPEVDAILDAAADSGSAAAAAAADPEPHADGNPV